MIFDAYVRRMMAVFVFSLLAVIAAEALRYLTTSDSDQLRIIHDGDPGADDAMAMLMVLSRRSRAELMAVTCVEGNTGVVNSTLNAWLVLEAADRTDIPVHGGTRHGMVFEVKADNYFGYDGFGDAFQRPLKPLLALQHAAIAMVDIVKAHPGKISLLCTGPLTNIALAIHLYPRFLQDVKEVVVLGGSYKGGGNRKPGAEFNFAFDPEAAALVFSKAPSDKLIKLIPLETVESVALPLSWRLDVLGSLNSSWIKFLNLAERKTFPKVARWRPFDQLAAAVLLDPRVATNWRDTKIFVETCGDHGRGAVFVDYSSRVNNVRIISGIDVALLKDMLLSLLA